MKKGMNPVSKRLSQDGLAMLGKGEFTEEGKQVREAVNKYIQGGMDMQDKASMFLFFSSCLGISPQEFTEILRQLQAVNEQARKIYNY
ncbi:hypothetical protein B4086_5591 [Bacillus cereus]|nr:hypothetical protein B4086_5591 [Bacillus cereus]